MKLFFDARYIRTDFHDGISRYTTELANALAELTPVTFLISDDKQHAFLPKNANYLKIHAVTSWREPLTALLLNKHRPDVVTSPLQTIGSIGRKFKLILNQQDMSYYKISSAPTEFGSVIQFLWRLYHKSYIPGRIALNAADIVATVSETSKQEILAAKLTKRPVVVVPNAAEDLARFLEKAVEQGKNPPKNLVYMGAFLPHKNVEVLIQMMEFLPGRTLHLLSRISPRRYDELKNIVPAGAHVVFHCGVSDEQYAQILANDAIMVSASKAEGFGLPLVEALQLGVPAVVTDMPIFHEVAGKGALFANPDDPKNFADKIIQLDSQKVRQQIVKKGQAHIKKFSWQNSAEVLFAACQKLV